MSRLPLSQIFSAAHTSKWDALPKGTLTRATQSTFELERCDSGLSTDGEHDEYSSSESSRSGGNVFSTRECEITVRVAARERCVGWSPKSREANMVVKTYTWIALWFILSAPIVLWDAGYCFMRPRSMVGGDLHWIWEPYGIYQEVDYVYGLKALQDNDGFTNAQGKAFVSSYYAYLTFLTAFLNLVETPLNLAYVYLAYVSGWSGAPLVGFTAATMTFSKTALYLLQEYYCGGCAVGHNSWSTLVLFWVIPNGMWIVFPFMVMWRLGSDIVGSLSIASRGARKAASGKAQ